jgi:hypothetical protein
MQRFVTALQKRRVHFQITSRVESNDDDAQRRRLLRPIPRGALDVASKKCNEKCGKHVAFNSRFRTTTALGVKIHGGLMVVLQSTFSA